MTSKPLCILFLSILALNVLLPDSLATNTNDECSQDDAPICIAYKRYCNDPDGAFAPVIARCPHMCRRCPNDCRQPDAQYCISVVYKKYCDNPDGAFAQEMAYCPHMCGRCPCG
ncbi:uncharacterized protein LOC117113379 [Anneissia japonica]|uniref:uncharacterized protein LOC117113379 n=1 Tax=Anneissia japonica TaxID=1529436 RepID=UPI00142561F8|nr:uncharacterized protein LOC117113379 [Anneissia japonica]